MGPVVEAAEEVAAPAVERLVELAEFPEAAEPDVEAVVPDVEVEPAVSNFCRFAGFFAEFRHA